MAQGDLLIFVNVVSWVFMLFFSFYFIFFGRLLPSMFKNMRVQLFTEVMFKKQFFTFFLNFIDNLFWYNLLYKKMNFNFSFLQYNLELYCKNKQFWMPKTLSNIFNTLAVFKW